MKKAITLSLFALVVVLSAAPAAMAGGGPYDSYPTWAQTAFDPQCEYPR